MPARTFAAVDIGASGGRVMAGRLDRGNITMRAVRRFPNGADSRGGHLRWDLSRLHREVLTGLAHLPEAESVGIDTWGVDYGLLDTDGRLIAEPVAYRDDRTVKVIDAVHAAVPPDRLYEITGVQFLPFNTIYQLAAERRSPYWTRAATAVLIPDLLAYWLTGELKTELTNASTTGLLDVRARQWSAELLDRLALPAGLLPPLESPGQRRGVTATGLAVTTVGSHDTASALVAVPATTDRFAYISSGTWSLVGLELDHPVLTPSARHANFTNETGVDDRIRFLRNVGGLWILQECLRAWRRDDLSDLLTAAGELPTDGPRFDVDDPVFIPPGGMPGRVATAAGTPAMNEAETVRCILDSLASTYARTIHEACAVTGATVEVVHVVGGGSRNALLCQLTADASGLPVLAGPAEATAVGNVLVQARAAGAAPSSLEALRAVVAASTPVRRFEPS